MSAAGLFNSSLNVANLTAGTVDATTLKVGGRAVGPGAGVVNMLIGYNNPLTFTEASAPPTNNGILLADISSLLPYFGSAVPPAAFPSLNVKAGNVICRYGLDKAASAFPATGTLFLYLSVDGSKLNADGAVIVQCIPLSNFAELVNDVDTTTPSTFTVNAFGSVLATATSLRLMAYYSAPTEPTWSIVLSLVAVGITPYAAILTVPPP